MKTNNPSIITKEVSLDPTNWDALKDLGGVMVNDMIDFLQSIREQPVWRKPPEEIKKKFSKELPQTPQPFEKVYEEFKTDILPYYLGNIHPRFWSWVMGTGSAQGMLADMLAAGINSNVAIGDQAPMYVDQQVVDWCKEMMNMPEGSSGALVNGASVANLNALIVARNATDETIRKNGLPAGKKMVIYASTEAHSCIQKAAEIIGIGSEGVRYVRVNDKYQMDTKHLEQLIAEDRKKGNLPFCIVVNVGTVNTGAIDPVEEIYKICHRENLWMHVDGAFGAVLKLFPEFGEEVGYIELADSIAFDLHKWMYMPYEAGVVLVKNGETHKASFASEPDYLLQHERGIAAGPEPASNYGFDLSRNFKALKVWMLMKENGINKYRQLICKNLSHAKYLEYKVRTSENLQLMAPVSTNIVCFRFFEPGLSGIELNELNKEILMQVQEEGIAAPSYTKLKGNYCLRVAITNHRSNDEDFDVFVEAVIRIGKKLLSKHKPGKLVA